MRTSHISTEECIRIAAFKPMIQVTRTITKAIYIHDLAPCKKKLKSLEVICKSALSLKKPAVNCEDEQLV